MKVEIDVSEIIKAVKANVQSVDTSDLAYRVQESLDIAWLTDQVVDQIDLHDLACNVQDVMTIYPLEERVERLEKTVQTLVDNLGKYRNAILAVGIMDGGQDD
tara:strand:- start:43 stop:351 length:309 start_codon:yes stop_codon:yes gene_type:complete